jgi:hypothetical protein
MMRTLLIFSILGTLLPGGPLPVPQTPTERAWLILQQGLANKRVRSVRTRFALYDCSLTTPGLKRWRRALSPIRTRR